MSRQPAVGVRPLLTGLRFPEAPRWRDGRLWFSDMLDRRVCSVDLDGQLTTIAKLDDMPGGLGFQVNGTPVVVGMNSARLFVLADGTATPRSDLGASADHLDDMVVTHDGVAYVGAVGAKIAAGQRPSGKVIRVDADGQITTVATGIAFPNGCAVSPDGRLLLSETMGNQILAFDIEPDGSLAGRRTFAHLPGLHPDGLALDAAGAVWIGCYSESIFVRVIDGGRITHVIEAEDRWATGVELGGPDGHTLFMTSSRTEIRKFFRGEAVGRIDTVRVDIPAATPYSVR